MKRKIVDIVKVIFGFACLILFMYFAFVFFYHKTEEKLYCFEEQKAIKFKKILKFDEYKKTYYVLKTLNKFEDIPKNKFYVVDNETFQELFTEDCK